MGSPAQVQILLLSISLLFPFEGEREGLVNEIGRYLDIFLINPEFILMMSFW